MQIEHLKDSEKADWDGYVLKSQAACAYHRIGWKDVIEKSFGHQTYYLVAKENGKWVGILPLVSIKSLLFGRFIVSLPFFNYGGICADSPEIERSLLAEAIEIAGKERAGHIEFRHVMSRDLGLPTKESKVAMVLDLPPASEDLWRGFKAKLRSQIKRAERAGMEVRVGGMEAVDDFYKVFSRNMSDLGTPVYSKAFFINILQTLAETTWIITIFYQKEPVASGFLVGFKGKVEIPWASSLRKYNPLAPNMLLYWYALKLGCERGYQQFDFGRSTPHSATYKFKEQWGTRPVQLYWQYWLSNGQPLQDISPGNPKYGLAIKVWKCLPLSLTRLIGPLVVKKIP
jgi:FemAB-related protein (PEP-CTERM system-associated)